MLSESVYASVTYGGYITVVPLFKSYFDFGALLRLCAPYYIGKFIFSARAYLHVGNFYLNFAFGARRPTATPNSMNFLENVTMRAGYESSDCEAEG